MTMIAACHLTTPCQQRVGVSDGFWLAGARPLLQEHGWVGGWAVGHGGHALQSEQRSMNCMRTKTAYTSAPPPSPPPRPVPENEMK